MQRAFRRSRWERVAAPDVVDVLAAEHDALDEAAQIEASRHVDEIGDEDLARDLAARDSTEGDSGDVGDDDGPTSEEPTPRRGRRTTE